MNKEDLMKLLRIIEKYYAVELKEKYDILFDEYDIAELDHTLVILEENIDIKRMSNEELLEVYKKYDKLTDKPHGLSEQLMFEEIKREITKREE